MRLVLAALLGAAAVVACAVVLGDYPLSGMVPWVAAVLIPLLIGGLMSVAAGSTRPALWVAAGPMAGGAMIWGIRIATGWGLDPVPAPAWAALAIAVVWPPVWGLWRAVRGPHHATPASAAAPAVSPSVDGELGDLRHPGRTQVGDP